MMSWRRIVAFVHDVLAAGIAWAAAFWLRFNLEIPSWFWGAMLERMPLVMVIFGALFWAFGLYRGLWRYASLPDLQRIMLAVGVGALAVPALFAILRLGVAVPRSVYLLTPLLLVAAMSASRLAYRAWREGKFLPASGKAGTPVLVLGAGTMSASLLKDLSAGDHWRVVGLLDDDRSKRGATVQGVKVLGGIDQLAHFAAQLGVTRAIIAMPSATHKERKRAVDLCNAAGISVMTVPALSDIVSGKVSVSALRPIELDDLLGRDPVELDDAGLHGFLDGRTVLVTGAGGSIGSELCRQIARFAPARIVMLDVSEFALYSIEQEFLDRHHGPKVIPVIGDAKDAARVEQVFRTYAPEVVFHAAAYKHVPMMENDNAAEAVTNNVGGTLVIARAAAAAGTEKFVLVSTDKAVNPTNVMGATKRLAELCCQSLERAAGTHFVVVRFGNVLGSTGSVIPRFREQIARGGPVTVTHPEIQRYFMSIAEAAQLVIQAGYMGRGGEIFVLDMGEPVKIVDLARQLIKLSGYAEEDIPITFTGLRPGEKLYEEVLADAERTLPTPHPKLRIARSADPGEVRLEDVDAWLRTVRGQDAERIRARLKDWLPEYVPASHKPAG